MGPPLLFALAGTLTTAAAWVVRAAVSRAGIVDPPDPHVAQHNRPVPSLGGVAIAAAGGATLLVTARHGDSAAVLVGAAIFLAVGALDDVHDLAPWLKLGLQVAAGSVTVALGLALPATGSGPLDAAAALAWVVLVVNAVNLTDVCDGLVSGLAVITFLGVALVDPNASSLPLIAAGCCFGFLVLNAPPASIFLGDSGSHLLGFLIAALSLHAMGNSASVRDIAASVVLVSVFLFELEFVVAVRILRGAPWWEGSSDHVALRLQTAGLSRWSTDALLWTVGGALAVAAWSIRRIDGILSLAVVVIVLAFFAASWRLLARDGEPPEAMS